MLTWLRPYLAGNRLVSPREPADGGFAKQQITSEILSFCFETSQNQDL